MSQRLVGTLLLSVVPLLLLPLLQADVGAVGAAAAIAIAVLLAERAIVALLPTSTPMLDGRARAHRQQLCAEPTPRHPRTPGRRRARAPGATPRGRVALPG